METQDWETVLLSRVKKAKIFQTCVYKDYCQTYKTFWNNGALSLLKAGIPKPAALEQCPHEDWICNE